MNNLSMKLKKESILQRLIKSLKSIFKKNFKNEIETIQEETTIPGIKITERYKVDNLNLSNTKMDNDKTMKEIIDIIEKSPEMLEKLDINKLNIIDQYYIEKIAKYRNMLNNIV